MGECGGTEGWFLPRSVPGDPAFSLSSRHCFILAPIEVYSKSTNCDSALYLRLLSIYITRAVAVAGIGSACGLGASPAPDIRESARAAPTHTQIPPGCTPPLQWAPVVAWSSTAVTTGFVRGHRAPVTTNNRRAHRDTHHRCTRMCKRSNLPPVFQVQSSPLNASFI
jgi:hypothetical protein